MAYVLLDRLTQLGVEHIDYVIANHAEQDHSGSIPKILELYPEAKVVTNGKCKAFLMNLLLIPEDKFIEIKEGDELSLGNKTLRFMAERGFNKNDKSQSRYDISVSLAKAFIKNRYDDNIGLVVFGTYAFSASPLTYDLKALSEMFYLMSDVGIAGTSTAIGDALMQGLRTLKAGEAKSKVLILLTDGQHNAGKNSPHQAVALAKERGVKVYTIGIGKEGDYDEELLSTIAKESGAKSFFASTSAQLEGVYKEIESLEPSDIHSEQYLNKEEYFVYPLFLAMLGLALLLWRYEERE